MLTAAAAAQDDGPNNASANPPWGPAPALDLAEQPNPGPTFDCGKARSPIAVVICGNQYAAWADWELSSAYLALYFSQQDSATASFRTDHHAWLDQLELRCLLQKQPSICIADAYRSRARWYRSNLKGDALSEARLSKEQRIAVQSRLSELGYYPGTRPDGLFGPVTRDAIKKFQASLSHTPSNFLSPEERQLLFWDAGRASSQPLAVSAPLDPETAEFGSATEGDGSLAGAEPSSGQGGIASRVSAAILGVLVLVVTLLFLPILRRRRSALNSSLAGDARAQGPAQKHRLQAQPKEWPQPYLSTEETRNLSAIDLVLRAEVVRLNNGMTAASGRQN
jgi:peptidoglycan hydrolase-like protein with peptidoglycan-binding domain